MNLIKRIILWLAFLAACFPPASALTITAPENCIWKISSIGYDAPTTEVTNLGNRTETSTSDYDTAPIRRAITDEIPTEAERTLFGQNAEFKAAEGLSPEIASTFANGEYTATTLTEDMTAYRYSGGVSNAAGRFLTTGDTVAQISSPVSASIALNLPAGATAETLNAFTIPAGTTIFSGGVAGGMKGVSPYY